MQVQRVQNNNYKNYNSPNFGMLNVTKGGLPFIESYGQKGAQKLKKWEEELANTKHFDLNIDNLCGKLHLVIKSKEPKTRNCEAPLYVFKKPKYNVLDVYGTDICDCQDSVWYPLKFVTSQDAEDAYNVLSSYKKKEAKQKSLDILDQIDWSVKSVKIMEQSFERISPLRVTSNVNSEKTAKLPLSQRIKKAWETLKG